jgi:hypothetical protein
MFTWKRGSQIRNIAVISTFVLFNAVQLEQAAAQDSGPKVSVVGIAVTAPDEKNEFGGSAVMGRSAGVEVHLRIEHSGTHFIGMAREAGESGESTIEILAGDQALSGENDMDWLAMRATVSDDAHNVTVPVTAESVPPGGTTSLRVRGKLIVVTATGEKTGDSEFEVVKGTELQFGNVPVTVEEIEEDPSSDNGLMITFQSKHSLDTIAEVSFLDEAGNPVESSSAGGGSFGFDDDMTYTQNYTIAGKPSKLTAHVKYFESSENLEVPLDLSVSLGLGGEAPQAGAADSRKR